jgi:uncharacterized repeat protein (TIGR02543 family)
MTTFQIVGLIVVALLGLYVFYCIYDFQKFNKKKDCRQKNKVMTMAVLLLATFAGQQAFATTKTVTYTMNYGIQSGSYYFVSLDMSGDTPFDGITSIESKIFSNRTSAFFNLADGFTFNFDWGSATSLQSSALGYCHSDVNLQYTVGWSFLGVTNGNNYYVTNVQLTDINGHPMNLEGGGTATTDYNYIEQQSITYTAAKGPASSSSTGFFKKLVITYTDAPGLSIFNTLNDGSYQIQNNIDLRHLADFVNRGQNNCSGLTFRQTNNISCDNTHTPIGHKVNGYSLVHFKGTYDGGGFTISNMNYSSNSSGDAGQDIGLFGYIEYGTVRNVVVANSTFTGFLDVGAIAGNNDNGTIQNCRVESDVTIKAGTTSAKRLGGIAGNISGSSAEIAGCICAASVTRQGENGYWTGTESFGGIVGYSYSGTIKDCLYTGSTINVNNYKGAIVGYRQAGYFSNNYYTNINLGGVNGNDMDGARRARTVTLNGNAALSGTETTYSLSNLTAIGPTSNATALRHGSTTYSGNTQNIHLTYNGTVPTGYSVTYTATAGTISGNTLTMPNNNVTVNATLVPITYNITYALNGGSVATANPTTYDVETATFTLNNPTKPNYDFAGWTGTGLTEPTMTVTIAQGSIGNRSYTATWTPTTYDITYELGGGSVASVNPITYNIETPTFTLNNPIKTGYTFDGWTGTDLTGATQTVTITQGSTGDRNYTANWTPITYNITYDLGGGSVATANPTTYHIETPAFTLNNPTRTGYTFVGWTGTDLTEATQTVTITQGSTGDRSYTAHWTPITYNITYDLGGGSVATANPITYNIETPTFTLNNPTKTGYTFDGWTGTDLTGATQTVTIAQGSTGDRSYTAHWTPITYTVHFDKNNADATGTMSNQHFTYDQAQNLTANAFTLAGYSFAGWCTTPDGAVVYSNQQSVSNLTFVNETTITLYAKWMENMVYTITYDLDGGSVATANPTTYTIETPTFTLNNPTKTGYTFDGWTGTDLTGATQTVTITQGSTGDRSYTANWTPITYTVHFDKNNADASGTMSDQLFTYDQAQNLTANTFAYTGFRFAGWCTTPDGAVVYGDQQSVSNLTFVNGATITLYAQWREPIYTITYDLNGGNLPYGQSNPATYDEVTPTFTLINPTQVGYSFDGWTGSNGNTPQTTVTITQGSTGDLNYTANWTDLWGVEDGADGSQQHPYIISTTNGLDLLATLVNNGWDFSNKFLKLGADIEYDPTALDANGENYTPIGNSSHLFRGTFDGDGHTISGIRINKRGTDDIDHEQGLFGKIKGGTVKNVTLSNTVISGFYYVGGIAGEIIESTVENCHVTNTVAVLAGHDGAYSLGGIVGYCEPSSYWNSIGNCTSAVSLGMADGVSDCICVGGITGFLYGYLSNCLVKGATIPDLHRNHDDSGAIIGYYVTVCPINHNYYTGVTIGGATTGIGVGYDDSSNEDFRHDITNMDAAMEAYSLTLGEHITATPAGALTHQGSNYYPVGTTVTLSAEGYNLSGSYVVKDAQNNDIPLTDGNTFVMPASDVTVTADLTVISWSGSGTQDYPWMILYPSQLDLLAERVNSGSGDNNASFGYSGKYFKLGADINYPHTTAWNDASSTENNYTAIGNDDHPFQGSFDGDGHTISGIRIYRDSGSNDSYQGLFGKVDSDGTVKDLTLTDARITGKNCVGGIVGELTSYAIQNCHVTQTVAIHAVVDNAQSHGGIVGQNDGTINDCTSAATLTFVGNLTGCNNYGGIVGQNWTGTVQNCLAIGANVSGNYNAGAIVGDVYQDGANHNYYHGCTVNGSTGSGIGCGDPAGDLTENDGALPCYKLTIPSGLATTNSTILNYKGNSYVAAGQTVTLTPVYEGYTIGSLTVTKDGTNPAETIAVSNNSFTMPTADVTVTATWGDLSTLWSGSGTSDDPYLITNCAQLDALAYMVNNGNTYQNKYFRLDADISYPHTTAWNDASSTENNFTAIGNNSYNNCFKGTFDGNCHTISGIRIYKGGSSDVDNYQGLFGSIYGYNNYSVKDLTVSDTRITGHDYVGSIVGYNNYGKVGNCHITHTVAIHAVSNNARYHGGVGGYYGVYNFCDCSATLSVADGVSGCSEFGGIVGYGGTLMRCFAMDVTIDGTAQKSGAIAGNYNANLSYNQYYNCRIGNATANIGTSDGDVGHINACMASEYSITIPGYGDGNGKWAFIATPMSIDFTPYCVKNLITTPTEPYDLYYFDESKDGAEWQNYKAHPGVQLQNDWPEFTIRFGKGFLYASKETVTLTFLGKLSGNYSHYISLSYTEGKPLSGWNLIGNPLTIPAYIDRPYYKMNAEGTDVEIVENYAETPIPVCTGVLVKATVKYDQLEFRPTPHEVATNNNGSLQMTLSKAGTSGDGYQDKAVVSFNEGTQLAKYVLNEEHAKLYFTQDGEDYAIVSVGRDGVHTVSTEIPVNIEVNENGEYTLTVSESLNSKFSIINYLHLIDNLTGADIDLLASPSYTFTAKTTDYASRFKLVFSAK